MAEYGYAPGNDNESRSILLAGGAAAVGLFALGRGLRPWANKQLRKDLDLFANKAASGGSEAAASRAFAHVADAAMPQASWGQALGMGIARGRPMRLWQKFAQVNTMGRLIDDLGFLRELREQYGAEQIQSLGTIERFGGVFHNKVVPGAKPTDRLFFAAGDLYSLSGATGSFEKHEGKYWLYGKAGAGERRSVFEKTIADLTGASQDPEVLKGIVLSHKTKYLELFGVGKLKARDALRANDGNLDEAAKALGVELDLKKLDRVTRHKAEDISSDLKGMHRTLNRLEDPSALGRAKRFLDVGLNERGHPMWTKEWRQEFRESLFGVLNPEDIPLGRESLSGYGVVRTMRGFKGVRDMFLGGRDGQINAGTIAAYHLFSRINTSVAWNGLVPGLALSGRSASSPVAYFANIMTKRALPLYASAFYAGYANDMIGQKTGQRPTDWAQLQWAAQAERFAAWKDRAGISKFARDVDELSGGALGYIAHPFVEAPVGLTAAELREQHRSGDQAVRKGRWWIFGSSTPFRGDRVQYFTPNYARKARAGDLNKTSTLYSSVDEYYANAALPTPTHPLSWLKHFFTDRYHWENKHYRDRPYPLTSPMFESTTPWGAVLNPTLGRLLKPTMMMHKDELPYIVDGPHQGRPNPTHRQHLRELNREIQDQANAREVTGFVTPSGAIAPMAVYERPDGFGLRAANEALLEEDPDAELVGTYGTGARGVAVYGSGKQKARHGVREANARVMSGSNKTGIAARYTDDYMLEPAQLPGVFAAEDPNDPRALRSLIRSDDPRYQAGLAYYSLTELGGIYGFSAVTATGDLYADRPTLSNAGRMTSFERQYWDKWNLGGLFPTPGLSEAFRRFIPHRFHSNTEYNPIRNQMPTWLPGQEGEDPAYFTDFLHGDPYVAVPNGEERLPGEAYDRLHGIKGGNYSQLDRLAILADVAPWSQQYRRYRDALTHSELSESERMRLLAIKAQVTARKKRFDFSPYRAKYSDLDYEHVRVKDVIDNNTFTTFEHPDNPIRLAGVHIASTDDAAAYISRMIHPGAHLRIGVAQDQTQLVSHDTLHTMRAVVFSHGTMVNRAAIDDGVGTEHEESNPAGLHVKYTEREIAAAKLLEGFAHTPIPAIHNKFLPVDSPLELYRRTQVYGKDWQDWRHPFRDYLFPSLESAAQQGLAGAMVAGYLGYQLGVGKAIRATAPLEKSIPSMLRYAGGLRLGSRAGLAAGFAAAALGLGAYRRHFNDAGVPAYRRRERDINEYFDVLKYVKFEGLYEKTRSWIKAHQHHDIGTTIDRYAREGEERKRRIQVLKSEKRNLIVHGGKREHADRIREINAEIHELQSYRRQLALSREDVLALQYKNLASQTLYGAERGGPLQNVLMAMPAKEREFFQAFLKAPGPEREQILRLVPRNERRFLESAWGMKSDERPTLESYFQGHYLPGADWGGWKTNENLNDYKLVVMKQEGLDMTTQGFWPQDEQRVKEQGTRDLRPLRPTGGDIRRQVHAALTGMGLRDVDVDLIPNRSGAHKIDLQIEHDRKDEIKREQLSLT